MRSVAARLAVIAPLAVLGAFALAMAPTGCSSSSAKAKKPTTPCKPGSDYFCLCSDGANNGQWTCNDDGASFGVCQGCPDPLDPGLPPDEDPVPLPERDAGPLDAGPGPAGCGNGKVEPGEACDDGNSKAGDGCSDKCLPDGNPESARQCPGMPVHIWGDALEYTGTTTGYSQQFRVKNNCTPDGGASASTVGTDRVFELVVHKTGMLKIENSNVGFDQVIYAGTVCAPVIDAAGRCANEKLGKLGETLSFAVKDGETYYLVIDAPPAQDGKFTVRFSVQ
jgi:cysteine-rich repeat protein